MRKNLDIFLKKGLGEAPALLEPVLDINAVELAIGSSRMSIHRWIAEGAFPVADYYIGGRKRLWKMSSVKQWLDAHREPEPRLGQNLQSEAIFARRAVSRAATMAARARETKPAKKRKKSSS